MSPGALRAILALGTDSTCEAGETERGKPDLTDQQVKILTFV